MQSTYRYEGEYIENNQEKYVQSIPFLVEKFKSEKNLLEKNWAYLNFSISNL